jgi:uncharacterized DUF497 family protein
LQVENLVKHGMDFADLNERFFDSAVVLRSYRNRSRAIGVSIRGVIAVIFAVYGQEAIGRSLRQGVDVISQGEAPAPTVMIEPGA